MKPLRLAPAAVLLAAILAPGLARGAGYSIYEQGAVVLGMAGAGTASVDDASALFFNPAAIVRLKGRQLSLGGTWLSTHTSFAGVGPSPGFGVTEAMKAGSFFPPTVYFTSPLGKKWAFGLGLDAPYGLGVEWQDPDAFTGRFYVTKADLRTLDVPVDLAWAPSSGFSVGGGVNVTFAQVELDNIAPSGTPIPGGGGAPVDVRAQLKSGYQPACGFNLGLLWQPQPVWKLAAAYHGRMHPKIDHGDATFAVEPTGNPAVDAAAAAALPPSQTVTTMLKLPAMLSLGAAWNPRPDWTWELDFNQTYWSFFDALDLGFDKTPALDTNYDEGYHDSFRISLGAEHRLARATYRFGYYFDQAAAPDKSVTPLLPDANRHGATLGLGWKLGARKQWALDLYNLALFVEDRSTNGQSRIAYDGTYKTYVNAAGANLAYHW